MLISTKQFASEHRRYRTNVALAQPYCTRLQFRTYTSMSKSVLLQCLQASVKASELAYDGNGDDDGEGDLAARISNSWYATPTFGGHAHCWQQLLLSSNSGFADYPNQCEGDKKYIKIV